MNREERRRALRKRVHPDWHRPEDWWWRGVSERFGRPVADFVGYATSAWQSTAFGTCAECGLESVPVSVVKEEFEDNENEMLLALTFEYVCGHHVPVHLGVSPGFPAPGLRECMLLVAESL